MKLWCLQNLSRVGSRNKLRIMSQVIAIVRMRPIEAAPWCGLNTSDKKVPSVVNPLIKMARRVAAS